MSNNPSKSPPAKTPPNPVKPGDLKPSVPPPPKSPAPPSAPAGPVPPLFRRIDWWCFGVTTLLVMIGYWWTLAPDLTLEDCGELAVGSMYAGVPHPPGYPVWTIYSWLFTLLPIENIAYRVALSSAVAGALSCGLVALMVSRGSSMILEGIAELKNIETRWENALCIVSGFVAGMLIGFNGFMWSQAVIVEVYTLSVLSMAGVLVCLLRWIYAPHQRRYLYLAFFWFGICFNNHQSLLVIAMGLEVAILAAAPKLGRALFFWNVVIYLAGLIGKQMGMINTLNDNVPLMIVYHSVGFASLVVWIALVVRTKKTGIEFVRDLLLVGSLGYLGALFLSITRFTSAFENKPGVFVLFNLFGLGMIAALVYVARTAKRYGSDWAAALGCGGAWIIGAAFYLYMPIASMSNPPLNWGYPRTVAGFFHAFTRGQYERIHPSIGQSSQADGGILRDVGRYVYQIGNYTAGTVEEFNLVYLLIGLLPLFFLKKLQRRERAWMIGLIAIYITLSLFLLNLLNPAPDRQSRDLNRVFFTASHVVIAMAIGYGLTLVGAYISLHYERARKQLVIGLGVAIAIAFFGVLGTFTHLQAELTEFCKAMVAKGGLLSIFGVLQWAFELIPPYSEYFLFRSVVVYGLILAIAAFAIVFISRTRPHLGLLLVISGLLSLYPVLSHWSDNEQRGHYFGYWFGHDMFRPPFKDPQTGKFSYDAKRREELLKGPQAKLIYPEMERDTVLYGGTDPGRFNPTYMIFCESFIPPSKRNAMDREFDRRDVVLITQNALADGTYLQYIRAHYNRSAQIDPPFFSELLRGPGDIDGGTTNFVARMMRPLDNIFLSLGDNIEKERRAGSSFFDDDHFVDYQGFVDKLRQSRDPVSKYLFDNLSKDTQQALSQNAASGSARNKLIKDLNHLLEREISEKGSPLYETNRFAAVSLTERTRRFIKENPQSHTRIRLNRILLEEVYPKELSKSLGGVYPDMEILTASEEDSRKCFKEYLDDAQRRLEHDRRFPNEPRQIKPGEDVRIVDNRVTVSGQVAVMAINALLTRVMFDKNPDREFYVEESFPLDWMYPYLTPYGIIMKINRNPLPELSQDILDRDHEFWAEYSKRLIGNWVTYDTPISNICAFAEKVYLHKRLPKDFTGDPAFIRDNDGQKAFSKLRSSIAGVYNWRIGASKTPQEQQRMLKEAEFAFKQAYAFCPYSPEALFRYVNLLLGIGRIDDALLLAATSQKLDPYNGQIDNLIFELKRIKAQQGGFAPPAAAVPDGNAMFAQVAALETQFKADPNNLQSGLQLASAALQAKQPARATEVLNQIIANPGADANTLTYAANLYAQLGQVAKVEESLVNLMKIAPTHMEGRYELAAFQAIQNKTAQAIESLTLALQQSAQRLERDPKALNLYSNVLGDARFASLRTLPDFAKLLETFKPK